jgi:hypothetical protein
VRGSASRLLAACLVGFAVALVLGFVPFADTGLSAHASQAQGRGSVGCPSSTGHEVVRRVRLPGKAGFPLLAQGSLWLSVQNPSATGHASLARIDPGSGQMRLFPLPVNSSRLAYGFGSVWITGDGKVVRLSARSGRVVRVIRGRRMFGPAIAVTADGVWVGGADIYPEGQGDKTLMHWMYKIDPRRNIVVREVYLAGTTSLDFAAEGKSLWVSGWGGLVKISPSGRVVSQQRFDGVGWSVTRTPGAVWVTRPFSGNRRGTPQKPAHQLLKVATSGQQRVTRIDLDTQPGDVSAAAGTVWIGPFVGVNAGLARVDALHQSPALTRVAADLIPTRLAAFDGGVWASERDTRLVSEIC